MRRRGTKAAPRIQGCAVCPTLPPPPHPAGRNLVKYLLDNNLASEIRVVDKRLPFMAFLAPDHKAAMEAGCVECVQADCSDDSMLERALAPPPAGGAGTYAVNQVVEKARGQGDAV